MNITDHITQIANEEDKPFLRSKLLDVNIRLLKSSPQYKALIEHCAEHLRFLALSTYEGFPILSGISGANAGIPFNIIGVVYNRGAKDASCKIMLNPKITMSSRFMATSYSNCGSIRLPKFIPVLRHRTVLVEWFDLDGVECWGVFPSGEKGFTVQHEIDHNNGILITDKEIRP